MNVNYCAHGLNLSVSIAIPALQSLPANVSTQDVAIHIGETPGWARQVLTFPSVIVPTSRNGRAEATGEFLLVARGEKYFELRYRDGTRFIVDRQGTQIWGEAGPGLTNEDVVVYLLGPILGFVLRRRGRLTLHASAVGIGGCAVALAGSGGCGKSTTAAALALRGWPVVSEDVCGVETGPKSYSVVPSYPRVCLWPDSVQYLYSNAEALPLIVKGWGKRYLALDGSKAFFADKPLPLAAIYLLADRSEEATAPRIDPISPREAALQLVQNTYMNWLLDRSQRAAEFDAIAKLVTAIKCFRVTPSNDPARIGKLAALLEAHALNHVSGEQNDGQA